MHVLSYARPKRVTQIELIYRPKYFRGSRPQHHIVHTEMAY